MFEIGWWGNLTQHLVYYLIVLCTFIYLLNKYKGRWFYISIIILFYPALFSFLGKNFQDFHKIISLLLILWMLYKRNIFSSGLKRSDFVITFFFVLYSTSYFYSALHNNDGWTIIFSQYSRYFIVFFLWFLVRDELRRRYPDFAYIGRFIYLLFLMQVIITIGKIIVFDNLQIEGIVGSISHQGGAVGTTIPILGFISLWFYRKGNFTRKDWFFVLGLMLLGFAAGKRAIWFIMPVVIAAFMIYVPKMRLGKSSILVGLIMAPLAFYIGVRLTPTLNPDNMVWGSFDLMYTLEYAETYQFGSEEAVQSDVSYGRGGATLTLWDNIKNTQYLRFNDWFGVGLSAMYATDYAEFDELDFGLAHKGNATGVFQTYVTTGYIGVFFTVLFFFSILWQLRVTRIKWALFFILAWEYFMYTGILFRTPAFMFLVVYFIHYSNFLRSISLINQTSSLQKIRQ